MSAWTKKHGLTPDSLGPTLHLEFVDFKTAADFNAFRDALKEYPDMHAEVVEHATDFGGVVTASAAKHIARTDAPEGEVSPRVAEAIAHYERWVAAGKPVDGVA